MSTAAHDSVWFEHDRYRQARQDIMSLKAKLPERMVELLAREVIVRLAEPRRAQEQAEVSVAAGRIDELCHCLLSDEERAGEVFVAAVRSEGVPPETIYQSYLAAAARRLGEMWDRDEVSFTEVTIGTGRIYAIMRGMRPLFSYDGSFSQKSALFATVPGETHTLGIVMATDLFRKEGWEVDLVLGQEHDDLVDVISRSPHTLVGLSAGGAHATVALARLIVALRISKPNALIMVSGQVVNEAYDAVSVMDVDGAENDFDRARIVMETFWRRRGAQSRVG